MSQPLCISTLTLSRAAATPWDVVVIGAGPAGSVAAHALAARNFSVLLVDRACMPRPKVCGCCLAPQGIAALTTMGLHSTLQGAAKISFCSINAGTAAAHFPAPGYLAIARELLDTRLASAARDAGADLLLGASARIDSSSSSVHLTPARTPDPPQVCGDASTGVILHPRTIIIADGLSGTSLNDRPEFTPIVRPSSRMGVGAAILRPPIPLAHDQIALLTSRDGYLGLVRLPSGEIDAAAALDPSAVRTAGGPAQLCARIVTASGGDPAPLLNATWRGTSLLSRARPAVESGNIFVVGDSAGYVEPFTGEGMTWAIHSALALADIVADRIINPASSHSGSWTIAHNRLLSASHLRCRVVASLVRSPRLMHAAVKLSRHWPATGRWAAGLLGPSIIKRAGA